MKAFLDLGSNKGKILKRFIASPLCDEFTAIHAFEPNPQFGRKYISKYPKKAFVHREAVWTIDGTLDFFLSTSKKRSVACTALSGKKTGHINYVKPAVVQCIDFSKWLGEMFTNDDEVICKCDIEGAEYPVFKKMCEEGTIKIIKRLYMERHWQKFGWKKSVDDEFVSMLRANGLEPLEDYSKFE